MDLLSTPPRDQLEEFLKAYSKLFPIDVGKAKLIIQQGQKYYKDARIRNEQNAPYQKWLISEWYKYLPQKPRYDIYNHEYYFTDMWACWSIYSRGYVSSIAKHGSLNKNISIKNILANVRSIADLGCGIGYTTALIKQMFPSANVFGTNIQNTKQFTFCQYMAQKYNFSVKPNIDCLPKIDLVFASEYFEHIYDALDELEKTILKLQPKFLLIANSFNTISFGHFKEYKSYKSNKTLNEKVLSRNFNKLLKFLGYKQIKTKLWNNKPALWTKA